MRTAILLLIASVASAATYTTTGTGNWSDHTKWTPDPGVGHWPCDTAGNKDRVSVGHLMTVDASVTCGQSGPGTPYRSAEMFSVTATGGGASGGTLTGGLSYFFNSTCVDSGGTESGFSADFINAGLTVASGNIPRVTWPVLPAQCASRNLYVGTSAGVVYLYASGITGTTYDLAVNLWNNNTQAMASAPQLFGRGAAVLVTAGGLTLASGQAITLRGDLAWRNNGLTLTMHPGASIQFDGSQALSPSTASYVWIWGTSSGTDTNLITDDCTSGSPCSISSNSGGASAWVANATVKSVSGGYNTAFYNGKPQCTLTYVYIDGMGSASDDSFICGRNTGTPSESLSHVIFGQNSGTGLLRLFAASGESILLDHVSFKHSIGIPSWSGGLAGVMDTSITAGAGTLQMQYVYADAQVPFLTGGWTLDHVIFWAGWYQNATPTTVTNSFLRLTTAGGTIYNGTIDNTYVLTDENWATASPLSSGTATSATASSMSDSGKAWTVNAYQCCNGTSVLITGGTGAGQARSILNNTATTLNVVPNWATTPDATSTYVIMPGLAHLHVLNPNLTSTFTNIIFDYMGTQGAGHNVNSPMPNGATLTIKNTIATINPGMAGSGDLGIGTTGTGHVIAEHNTVPADGLLLGDYATASGGLSSFKANLVWSIPGLYSYGSGVFFVWNSNQSSCTGTPQDQLAVGAGDYNYGFNLSAACTSGYGYSLNLSTPAGTHDVRQTGTDAIGQGPQFVDPFRNYLKWAQANGSTGTIPQVLADAASKMVTVNDFSGATTTYTIDSLTAWVRAGYVPRNPTLNFTYPGDANAVQNVGAVAGNFVGLPSAILAQPTVW